MHSGTDIIRRLGFLALGTRFKRIGDQLQAGVAEAFASASIPLQPAQVPLLLAVQERPGISIGELVEECGISQPAVSRTIAALRSSGFLVLGRDEQDKRSRTLQLTALGEQAIALLEAKLFGPVAAAAEALCEGPAETLLIQLARIEERLKQERFASRIARAAE